MVEAMTEDIFGRPADIFGNPLTFSTVWISPCYVGSESRESDQVAGGSRSGSDQKP